MATGPGWTYKVRVYRFLALFVSLFIYVAANLNKPVARINTVNVVSCGGEDVAANKFITAGRPARLEISGKGWSNGLHVKFTNISGSYGDPCLPLVTPTLVNVRSSSVRLTLYIPGEVTQLVSGAGNIWLCTRPAFQRELFTAWMHQGENGFIPVVSSEFPRSVKRRSAPSDEEEHNLQLLDEEGVTMVMGGGVGDPRARVSVAGVGAHSGSAEERTSGGHAHHTDPVPDRNVSEDVAWPTWGARPALSPILEDVRPSSTGPKGILQLRGEESVRAVWDVAIHGIRVESHAKGLEFDSTTALLQADTEASVRIFGVGLTNDTLIQFTGVNGSHGDPCDVATSEVFKVEEANGSWAVVTVNLPIQSHHTSWYICLRPNVSLPAVHQGTEGWLSIQTYSQPIPLYIQIVVIVVLLVLSGLFSGLNLGLMALDKTELKIVINTGPPAERRYARAIEPVRRHGNFLLCTLLLGNVLVNSTLTILLDNLSSGLIAVIASTIGIVIFGEIVPQAICSRHGLAIGARTVWLVRVFMVITGPVAWPISKILDYILGEEIGNVYDRDRLKELIKVTQDRNDIRLEEQNIICGALELHKKTVAEVMTKIENAYMLSIDTCLNFDTINEIMQQGYSRIPIYESDRNNIVSVLFIKDLAFVDPDDNTPIRTLSQFYQNPLNFVFEDTTLDIMFREFKEGNKGHMAFVQHVNNEGDCDPFYEVMGIITLEDVIEELIQEEIVDETDVFTDNTRKRKRQQCGRRDFKEFFQPNNQASSHKKTTISPQLQVAALQFLRTSVEPFKDNYLSESIVKRILKQDIIHVVKPPSKTSAHSGKAATQHYLYTQGKPADYFVLILEGHVSVNIGKENLTFESGSFSYFGLPTLMQVASFGESPSVSTQLSRNSVVGSMQSLDCNKFTFNPDYSVQPVTEVTYLKVRRTHYIAARRAHLLEQSQKDPQAADNFDREIAKILREDDSLTSPALESTPLTSNNHSPSKEVTSNGEIPRSVSEDKEDVALDVIHLTDNLNSDNQGDYKTRCDTPSLSSCDSPTKNFNRISNRAQSSSSLPGSPKSAWSVVIDTNAAPSRSHSRPSSRKGSKKRVCRNPIEPMQDTDVASNNEGLSESKVSRSISVEGGESDKKIS